MEKKSTPSLRVFALVLLLGSFFAVGCAAVLVGSAAAGTVAYVEGELQKTEKGSVAQLAEATEDAFKDLEYKQISKTTDQTSAELIARTSGDDKVTVKLTMATDDTTKVGIRVGMFGNQELSLTILDQIEKNL
jgi:hypothetical protein